MSARLSGRDAQLFEIRDQPGAGRFPSELFPRLFARGGHVARRQMGEPAEIGRRLVRPDGFDRERQAPANGLGDVARRDAFLRDRVIDRARFRLLDREPVKPGDVDDVRGGPSVSPVPDIGEHALFPSDHDPRADQALPLRVMNLGQAHDGYVDPAAAAASAAASSEAARGKSLEVTLGASSLASSPGGTLAIAVPEVTISGRPEPARTEPSVPMTRRSVSQFAMNCEKSWLNARWTTPSERAAPSFRLSGSSIDPR